MDKRNAAVAPSFPLPKLPLAQVKTSIDRLLSHKQLETSAKEAILYLKQNIEFLYKVADDAGLESMIMQMRPDDISHLGYSLREYLNANDTLVTKLGERKIEYDHDNVKSDVVIIAAYLPEHLQREIVMDILKRDPECKHLLK